MKNIFLLVGVFLTFSCFSQNKLKVNFLAEYSLNWQPDSLNPLKKITSEKFQLYVTDSISLFISENRIGLDTLLYGSSNLSDLPNLMSLPKPSLNKRIVKYQSKNLTIYDDISSQLFSYKDEVVLNWEIKSDTLHIGNLIAKKALTNFRGRKYVAWFCQEIPISEGPYKFYGLPGLIVKIYDEQKHYEYNLIKYTTFNIPKQLIFNYDEAAKKVLKVVFDRSLKEFNTNPIPLMESEGAVFSEETKKLIKERFKSRTNSSNNKIELIDF
jgi:GLPGLI family protein